MRQKLIKRYSVKFPGWREHPARVPQTTSPPKIILFQSLEQESHLCFIIVCYYEVFGLLRRINRKERDAPEAPGAHYGASVITIWLGQYNLRKVQYLAGHRYISSTERYLQNDLENLHEMVNNFHPIG
ncbi:MAG: hypothetical protein WBA61_02595 [Aequorivita sp.]